MPEEHGRLIRRSLVSPGRDVPPPAQTVGVDLENVEVPAQRFADVEVGHFLAEFFRRGSIFGGVHVQVVDRRPAVADNPDTGPQGES